MSRLIVVLVLVCAVVGCTGAAPPDDMVLRRAIRLGNASEAEAGSVYWGARIRVSDDARQRLIFDLDAKTVTLMDKRASTYIVRTLDEVVRQRERQRGVPGSTNKVVLVRTDITERIAGHEARQYTFTGGAMRGAVWVSDEVRPPAVWREWEGLIAYLEGAFAGGIEITEAVAELDGYPLRTALTFGEGEGAWTITTQIAEVALGKPAEDLTIVPPDFKRANDFPMPG